MTLQQIAKQLNLSPKELERESVRVFLLAKLGSIEAKRQQILKKYKIESTDDWDKKLRKGSMEEGGYKETEDYFTLDFLETEKGDLLREITQRA